MRRIAKMIGTTWCVVCFLAMLFQGVRQVYLGAPGLLFQSGFGDVYLFGFVAFPGILLAQWGWKTGDSEA